MVLYFTQMALGTLLMVLFSIFSMIISIADFKTGEVPRIAFVIAFPAFYFLKALLFDQFFLFHSITGLVTGLAIFFLAFVISGRKLGLADVWYSGLIGMILELKCWYIAIGIACVTGMIYILISRNQRIPFIPLMAIGSIAMFVIRPFVT